MGNYFKPAGDLTENNKSNQLKNTFIINDSIDNKEQNRIKSTFNKVEEKKENDINEINNYLSMIASGKEYGEECDMGVLCSKGECILSLKELKKMINEGNYNIIEATFYNSEMINVRYEKYNKDLKMFK